MVRGPLQEQHRNRLSDCDARVPAGVGVLAGFDPLAGIVVASTVATEEPGEPQQDRVSNRGRSR
jgi:hypothetical protein